MKLNKNFHKIAKDNVNGQIVTKRYLKLNIIKDLSQNLIEPADLFLMHKKMFFFIESFFMFMSFFKKVFYQITFN